MSRLPGMQRRIVRVRIGPAWLPASPLALAVLLPPTAAAAPEPPPRLDPRWLEQLPPLVVPLPKPPPPARPPAPAAAPALTTPPEIPAEIPEIPETAVVPPAVDAAAAPPPVSQPEAAPEIEWDDVAEENPDAAPEPEPGLPAAPPFAGPYRWQVQVLAGRSLNLVEDDRRIFMNRYAFMLDGLTLKITQSRYGDARDGFHRLRVLDWTNRQDALNWCRRLRMLGHQCLVTRVIQRRD